MGGPSTWTPVEWGFVIGAIFNGVCGAISAWQARGAKEGARSAADGVKDAAAKSEMRGEISLTHLRDLKVGTEAIRTQTNGSTDALMSQNRDLLMQINQVLLENGKLTAEVAGLRTIRTGGRSTDHLHLVPAVVVESKDKAEGTR